MAFLLPGFDIETSSACGCGCQGLDSFVGYPADHLLNGAADFFDAYIDVLDSLLPYDKNGMLTYKQSEDHYEDGFDDIKSSIRLLSSPNNYFPTIEQVGETVVARVQRCALSTVSEGCKVIGVLTYNVREEIMLGCVSNDKLKTYFIVAGNYALTRPVEEAHAPALCGSNTQTAEQILAELRTIKFPDLPDLEYAD
jgi:hypothetical protein